MGLTPTRIFIVGSFAQRYGCVRQVICIFFIEVCGMKIFPLWSHHTAPHNTWNSGEDNPTRQCRSELRQHCTIKTVNFCYLFYFKLPCLQKRPSPPPPKHCVAPIMEYTNSLASNRVNTEHVQRIITMLESLKSFSGNMNEDWTNLAGLSV